MSTITEKYTDYGKVIIYNEAVVIAATGSELRAWASRPGAAWPCSELAEASEIVATFEPSGLVDIMGDDCIELTGDELSAWSADVLRDTLPKDHPTWFVTVGQFEDES